MHWAMRLHNELQRQGRLRELSWDDKKAGPSHNVVWTSIALSKCYSISMRPFLTFNAVNEIEYGRGSARKKQSARDEAAKKALEALEDELFEPVSRSLLSYYNLWSY